MSIYGSSTSWDPQCSNPNQSPINLSQSFAKPCDLLCELVMDDVMIPQANVIVSNEGLIMDNEAGLGSCKFNGEGYTCTKILVNHPSHHTIENIQADAEVIAIFTNPTGKYLCVSALVRTNPSQSPSTHFFNSFVGYSDATKPYTTVNLGENWGLHMMVPSPGSYYVYDGTMVIPNCMPAKWVVFKAMINIDPNDFANLVRTNQPGSRPIQGLGDRQVYFNDVEQLPGGPMPHDNKTYMRCKRLGKKGDDVKPVTAAGVKDEYNKNKKGWLSGITKFTSDQINNNGIIGIFDLVLFVLALALGVYLAYNERNKDYLVSPILLAQSLAGYIRTKILGLFMKPLPEV
jgi:carbonic anhydrase